MTDGNMNELSKHLLNEYTYDNDIEKFAPVCDICGRHVEDDFYNIEDIIICENCIDKNRVKLIEYVEEAMSNN